MDFRILGPLEVRDGARLLPVRGRLHPKLLAGLLLNNGRAVSLDWLIDLLWGDDPPATAQRQAQNAMAALRRQLTGLPEDVIQRVGRGYRIDVPDDSVDLRRFEAGARLARRLAESGNHQEAFTAFEAALELWRGPALDGLSGRTPAAAAARLNDSRLSTIEDYAEVALRLGRARHVLPDLLGLADANPLRQRLTARLMVALYQQSRTAEALRHFDSMAKRLADELGIDPSPELRELHARILRDDSGLLPRPTAALSARSVSAPAQLPADISTFAGRGEHLATLDRLLDTGSGVAIVSTVTGIGGVGKTALAVHWGHARKDEFPDGQLYINLRGFEEREPIEPFEAVVRLLRSLGQPDGDIPGTLDEASARYRSVLSERRVLIVLDNARTAEQVRPLLPGGAGCLAVVTSRNRLSSLVSLNDARPVQLDTLSPGESFSLLTSLIGPEALRDEAGTASIAESCAHLPL
ncbi:MAG: BTAD domain-containing putative transcriptional regulator, partial [Stackebrandtia sp.]